MSTGVTMVVFGLFVLAARGSLKPWRGQGSAVVRRKWSSALIWGVVGSGSYAVSSLAAARLIEFVWAPENSVEQIARALVSIAIGTVVAYWVFRALNRPGPQAPQESA